MEGPEGQIMHAGFISLEELHTMFKTMGVGLFDRNIRAPLARRDGSKSTSVNQKITETLKRIMLDQTQLPSAFSFMHNGVTLYAQRLKRLLGKDGQYEITEPRILNGAQTVATVVEPHSLIARSYIRRSPPNTLAGSTERVLCRI